MASAFNTESLNAIARNTRKKKNEYTILPHEKIDELLRCFWQVVKQTNVVKQASVCRAVSYFALQAQRKMLQQE